MSNHIFVYSLPPKLIKRSETNTTPTPQRNEVLPARSNVELPFWLAKGFMEMDMVKVQLPKYYHPKFIQVFVASSDIANLRDKSYYFFELARHIAVSFSRFFWFDLLVLNKNNCCFCTKFKGEGELVGSQLCEIFLNRVKNLMMLVLHCDESIINNRFTFKLANLEYEIFKRGRKSMFAYRLWKSGKKLQNFQMEVMNKRKKVKTH